MTGRKPALAEQRVPTSDVKAAALLHRPPDNTQIVRKVHLNNNARRISKMHLRLPDYFSNAPWLEPASEAPSFAPRRPPNKGSNKTRSFGVNLALEPTFPEVPCLLGDSPQLRLTGVSSALCTEIRDNSSQAAARKIQKKVSSKMHLPHPALSMVLSLEPAFRGRGFQ